jgi:hypothetical protein
MSDSSNDDKITAKNSGQLDSLPPKGSGDHEQEQLSSAQPAKDAVQGDIAEDKHTPGQHIGIEESEENEPYLGPAWAVVMLVLYLLKELFPAEQYSVFWFFQIYILVLVVAITIFTLVKRYQFYRSEKLKRAEQ